jgi:hypothetical protein
MENPAIPSLTPQRTTPFDCTRAKISSADTWAGKSVTAQAMMPEIKKPPIRMVRDLMGLPL